MTTTRWFALVLSLLLVMTISAQDDTTTPDEIPVGTLISGTIDDLTPRQVYSVDGTRGAIVRITLATLSGDLDPILTIFDSQGNLILRRDDGMNSLDVQVTITFQRTDTYTLVVSRFAGVLGTTSGEFDLTLERVGVSSAEGSALQYGIPITNTITNAQPRLFFTFDAEAGDILNIEMVRSSGTLDPYVQVLDSDRFLIAENDDSNGTFNARIDNLLINEAGTYIVVATRYDGSGSFVLSVVESGNSGLGNSTLAPRRLVFNEPITDSLTENVFQRYYSFQGERDQIISITMTRNAFEGLLDAYLILTDANFEPLIENDDSSGDSNARIFDFRLPATGVYNIIATRYLQEEGTTYGEYVLTLTDEGNAFADIDESVEQLTYGTTYNGSIDDETSEVFFAFWGTADERVIISMDNTNGNLDPVLELLDANEIRMLRDDDSGFNTNARIDTTLTYTGVHIIRATRYGGVGDGTNTTGNFRLTLTRISGTP
ncbi:MAG: PPC domain-containing protein [Chloroflexota bacterium]